MSPVFVTVAQDDPRARPLLDELAVEYSERYGRPLAEMHRDLLEYPATQFAPPDGGLVVGLIDGVPVAGGAFQRYDAHTAELKRIWTSAGHRRRGLGRLVVAELERHVAAAGYRDVFLTTGWRQPEAVALYVAAGYTPGFDVAAYPVGPQPHPFRKSVCGPR
ncbi:GNAT family N-acetyltransferase [Williamsia deligens]|uniref:GNAT family N-acetyltransferase n=1 Tax=Williamsia deligens TaxID=321325 RepID=A0ABW3G8B0_9NOCA